MVQVFKNLRDLSPICRLHNSFKLSLRISLNACAALNPPHDSVFPLAQKPDTFSEKVKANRIESRKTYTEKL